MDKLLNSADQPVIGGFHDLYNSFFVIAAITENMVQSC